MSRDEWRTPPEIFTTLDSEFGFEWDSACTSENILAPDGSMVDRGRDGTADKWLNCTWCNPPYSRIEPWLQALRDLTLF